MAVNQAPTVHSDSVLAPARSAQTTTSRLALRDTLPAKTYALVCNQHLAFVCARQVLSCAVYVFAYACECVWACVCMCVCECECVIVLL